MAKKAIWVSDHENEVLRGYLAELMDSDDTPDNDKQTLSEVYKQTLDNKCDLCLEVNIFEPLTKFEKLDICAECAEKIDEQHERRMRVLDQQ